MSCRPGDIVAGKYRIDEVLGAGGMGLVVAAHHLKLDERVAIKFLLPEALANPELVVRFSREARVAAKIRSEHVARMIDVGELPDGAPYLVMEHLEGSDLSSVVVKRGPLPLGEAVEYLLQACEAIAEAHSLGILHRDLKPANLFLCQRRAGGALVKVLDFGISKLTDGDGDQSVTASQAMLGSPLYMSPEQLVSTKDVDARTDVWSLGIILYELLAGKTPFNAPTFAGVALAIMQDPLPALSSTRTDLPRELDLVLARCLEKARTNRFENVAELAAALAPFAPRSAQRSVERISHVLGSVAPGMPAAVETVAVPGPSGITNASWGNTRQERGRPAPARRSGVYAALAIAIVGGAVAVWRFARGGAEETAAVAASSVVPPSVAPSSEARPLPVAEPVAVVVAPVTAAPSSAPSPATIAAITGGAKRKPSARSTEPPPVAKDVPAAAPSGFDFGGRH
jgi:serine/threonine protein kinase